MEADGTLSERLDNILDAVTVAHAMGDGDRVHQTCDQLQHFLDTVPREQCPWQYDYDALGRLAESGRSFARELADAVFEEKGDSHANSRWPSQNGQD